MTYQNLGKPVPRVEGFEKVTGRTQYAADLSVPNALWSKVLRSPYPHARLVRVDTSKAKELKGVHAVLCGADLPPVLTGLRMKDMPILAQDRVRYVGEPVAAVAADTPDIAEEALGLIEVQYEELPAVYDPQEAMIPGAPVLHENRSSFKNAPPINVDLPNIQSIKVWKHGDMETGFAEATYIFEHTFRTPLTHHGYLEPHACTVWVDPLGNVEVWASNKAPYNLRDRLSSELSIEKERIKVHILSVGGDFGGKTSIIDVPICYFLSERSGKPVKMVLSYAEELAAAAHRHPSLITLRTGVKEDGTLTAMDAKAVFSGGAYAALKANPEVTVMGPRRLASYYRLPAIHVETTCVYTNQVPCTQSRTPGSPQVVFAVESQMEIIARELNLDPIEFRMKNLLKDGEASPFGQKWDHIRARETLEKAIKASGWHRRKPSKYYGRGVALYERGANGSKANVAITIEQDAKLTVLTGVPETGPGIYTVMQQIVCEALGISPQKVNVRYESTQSLPYDPGTGGSKSTVSTGYAAYQAAQEVLEKLKIIAGRELGCQPEQVRHTNGRFVGNGRNNVSFDEVAKAAVKENQGPVTHLTFFEPAKGPSVTSFAAQVAEVEVEPETGQVTVKRITTAHDSGVVLNSLTYQGQVDGGVITGLGFATMEETPLADGHVTTANLGEFKIPTPREIPDLTTVLLESPTGPTPYHGKAIAEIPNAPTAAAIANAVADAIGIRLFELPLTAERVYKSLKQINEAG
ncbi:MAG: molybdopterin-dependent oxidoreductase [Deltaproteobacteria bacterium]|nr:molybdopterin-dependent oxidoreductase [Deltaproteobacteria bacterium]